MELNKNSFNQEGYGAYLAFKWQVKKAKDHITAASDCLSCHTSPEVEAYKIVMAAFDQLQRIEFKD